MAPKLRTCPQSPTPRDREGSFEPQLVKKHQTHMSDEIEREDHFDVWAGDELSGHRRTHR